MRRVCILGDSHAAALKTGWPSIADAFAGVAITYFSAPRETLNDVEVSGGRLVAADEKLRAFLKRTSGGDETIGPEFDLYLASGPGLRLVRHTKLLRAYRDSRDLDALRAGLRAGAEASPSMALAAKLRRITPAPIGVIATPLQGEADDRPVLEALAKSKLDRTVADAFIDACSAAAAEHQARFLPQPRETLAEGNVLMTRAIYAQAGLRIAARDVPDDNLHMNALYGAIVLREALTAMLGADV